MTQSRKDALLDRWHMVWTLALKDIVDALRNRLIISVMMMASLILLLPKLLPLIFEPPELVVPIYAPSGGEVPTIPEGEAGISFLRMRSETEFRAALCGSPFPMIGVQLPPDFDKAGEAAGMLELQGFVCWGNRTRGSGLAQDLQETLSITWDRPVHIQPGNWVYPPRDGGLAFSNFTLNAVLLVLIIGLFLVPTLLFEEKEAQTMQALLVSPASIGMVVLGKAGAGFFYILSAAAMIFGISWLDVVHWPIALLFVLLGGMFSVLVGLVIGSVADKQQDMTGVTTAGIVLLAGAVIARALFTDMPPIGASILEWVPSVAMVDLCRAVFTEEITGGSILRSSAVILAYIVPLYLFITWKIRRSDR